jgi:hypothetical protein
MDTRIKDITLTANQVSQGAKIQSDLFKGFAYWPGSKELVIVSEKELSEQDQAEIVKLITELPDEPVIVETERERLLKTLELTEAHMAKIKALK